MVLALAVVAAVAVGTLLGGRPGALADLPLRSMWLIVTAIALQAVAFPSDVLPWHTGDMVATWLWVASYGLLVSATVFNLHIRGMDFVAVGMGFNLIAILANGGHMPTLPAAAAAAGFEDAVHANSQTMAHPHLALLVDRWAAPDWIPLANVFSVGDVLLAIGAFAIVLPAMKVRLPLVRRLRGRTV
jgi:Family of unknown function (DUF5317)